MSTPERALPRPSAVVREQVRTVSQLLGPFLIISGIPLLLVVSIGIVLEANADGVLFETESFLSLLLLSYVLPVAVWWGQPFRSRPYHLAAPVQRTLHQLSRAGGGLLCLLAAVAAVLVTASFITAVTGGEMGVYLREGRELRVVPAWFWITPFVAAVVIYAYGTALMLGTKLPIVWGILSLWIPMLLMEMAENLGSPGNRPLGWLDTWAHGPFGFVPVLTGMSKGGGVLGVHPDFSTWLTAAITWSILAAIALTLALRRHRDH